MKDIMWMPDSEQVFAILPPSFRDKYLSTFAITDGSELFLQTPKIYLCSPSPGVAKSITILPNS